MNIFKRFWKSLFSPADIASFRKDKVGSSIFYIIVLTFVMFLPLAYFTTTTINNGLKVGESTLKNEIPDFTIEGGKLVTKDPSKDDLPISIDEGNLHVYFDASGTLDEDAVDNKIGSYDGAFAFLSKEIYVTAAGTSQSVSYDTLGIKDKDDVLSLYASITDMSKVFIPIILLIIFLFALGSTFFRVGLYGLFGYILTGFGRNGISYKENWMMATYAITLSATFTMIMEWLQIAVPYGMEINLVVTLIVLFLAIRSLPQKTKEQE
ncbi:MULTISPECIES: DUF1189 domain-containing protein [Listeria]|uniref:DUF1189 domain-containing protein n=1 Tax=Listeria TaxID=1637 RepID=UPI000B5964F7|nr:MULTISPECIES: DUF1189 domain-containing protein [Listeria]